MPVFHFPNRSPMDSLNILLVEDDSDDVELMRDALQERGIAFHLEAVKQGDAVLPFLKSCKKFPNIILLDLNLPKLHGREVLAKIKVDNDLKHIPVVILTTSSSQADKDYCLDAGATEFLTKPTTVDGFASCIQMILEIAGVKI